MKYNKTYIGLVVLVLILLIAGMYYMRGATESVSTSKDPVQQYKNGTYTINGEQVTLQNGASEKELNISPTLTVKSFTNYFGKELLTDLNKDGVEDAAIIITQNNNTGKIEYYLVVAITTKNGYTATNSTLIENDITPETPTVEDGVISIRYTKGDTTTKKSYTMNGGVLIEIQDETLLED